MSALSTYLEKMVNGQSVPRETAEQIQELLPSLRLQMQMMHDLPQVLNEAIAAHAEKLLHPEGKMLYPTSPTASPAVSDSPVHAIASDLLDRHLPGSGRFYGAARNGIQAAGKAWKENPKVRRLLFWTIGAFAASALFSFAAWFGWRHIFSLTRPSGILSQNGRGPTAEGTPAPTPTAGNQEGGQPKQRTIKKAAKGVPTKENQSPPSGSSRPNSPSAPKSSVMDVLRNHAAGFIGAAIPNPLLAQGALAGSELAAQSSAPSAPAATGRIPTPQGFQWERGLNGSVRLRWMSVGNGFRYTVYGAFAGPHPVFDVCFHPPMSGTIFSWMPPAQGPKVYDLYVVAVDSKGNESLPSPHQIINLRNAQ